MASSTNKTRQAQWRKYFEFCDDFNLIALPAEAHQICRFLVYLGSSLKYSSINNYLSGVIMLHKMYGYIHDFRSDFRVLFTLQGLRRVLGDVSCPKSPLLPQDLLCISKLVVMDKDLDLAVWACVVLAFRTLLRKSNLMPNDLEGVHCVRRGDIESTEWGMNVSVGSSKTIQFKQRRLVISVVSAPSSPLCTVSLVQEHFRRSPTVSCNDYIFMVQRRGKRVPLDYPTALDKLQSWASVAAPEKDIGFHSLRRGAATHMSIIGIKLEDIKTAGDWSSLSVLIYLTSPHSHKIDIDRIVANSLR